MVSKLHKHPAALSSVAAAPLHCKHNQSVRGLLESQKTAGCVCIRLLTQVRPLAHGDERGTAARLAREVDQPFKVPACIGR